MGNRVSGCGIDDAMTLVLIVTLYLVSSNGMASLTKWIEETIPSQTRTLCRRYPSRQHCHPLRQGNLRRPKLIFNF
ncbi:hypothetical protein J6590_042278 [Homalodisca vitripennis]|nr:hypothetical protein J6590_042278 [Homalodisca vitripennis]